MGTSAKRYGIDVKDDPELEIRLRRIEAELERRSAEDLGSVVTKRLTTIPQVTGLRVTGSTPGAVTVAWNSVQISDLRRYELEIAEDLAFTVNKQSPTSASAEFQISTTSATGGGGGTTLYVRVRARTRSGNTGVWSAVLNTTTGQAQTEDIEDEAVTVEKISTDSSIGGLKGALAGLTLTRPSVSTITIAAGSTSTLRSDLAAALTKSIASTWVVGDTNGGLATGSVAADTWYHVFLIKDDTNDIVDAGFDTSLTAVNLLATSGYDRYRLLGSVRTEDASTDLMNFHQQHELFLWTDLLDQTLDSTIPTTTAAFRTYEYVPPGRAVEAKLIVKAHAQVNEYTGVLYYSSPNQTNESTDAGDSTVTVDTGNGLASIVITRVVDGGSNNNQCAGGGQVSVLTDTTQRIRIDYSDDARATGAGHDTLNAYSGRTEGWIDHGLRGAVAVDS